MAYETIPHPPIPTHDQRSFDFDTAQESVWTPEPLTHLSTSELEDW